MVTSLLTHPGDRRGALRARRKLRSAIVATVIPALAAVAAVSSYRLWAPDTDQVEVETAAHLTVPNGNVATDALMTPDPTPPPQPSTTGPADAVWPTPIYARRYRNERQLALGFAADFVGFDRPVVGDVHTVDDHSEIDIRPSPQGPVTVVRVERIGPDQPWWVVGATSEHLVVAEPTPGSIIDGELHYRGEAWSPTGSVDIELRGRRRGAPLATRGFVTGGGDEPTWFEGRFGWRQPADLPGAIVFMTRNPATGQPWEATVIAVRLTGSRPVHHSLSPVN